MVIDCLRFVLCTHDDVYAYCASAFQLHDEENILILSEQRTRFLTPDWLSDLSFTTTRFLVSEFHFLTKMKSYIILKLILVILVVNNTDTMNNLVIPEIQRHHSSLMADFLQHLTMIVEFHEKVRIAAAENKLSIGTMYRRDPAKGPITLQDAMALSLECVNKKPIFPVVKFMEGVCEDCFKLYRDVDVYVMCRYYYKR